LGLNFTNNLHFTNHNNFKLYVTVKENGHVDSNVIFKKTVF